MADIFREVDEDVRRDRALDWWQRYQIVIIVLAVLVVAGAGAWRFYEDRKRSEAEAAGARYEAAAQLSRDNKPAEAGPAFQALAANGPGGYALLARFRVAADLGLSDRAKAVAQYDALAADAAVSPVLRDVAQFRAALLRVDEADAKEVDSRLRGLTQNAGPFRNAARELLGLTALKANDFEGAGRWLDAIATDAQAPAGMRQRAEALLGLVSAGKKP